MTYPALTVDGADSELVLAAADDFSPTAAEDTANSITIFFRDSATRDAARAAIARIFPAATLSAREIDDEDWARRSQENLRPITVGRITLFPSLTSRDARAQDAAAAPASGLQPAVAVVIQPSMGFGTGHHATTRLCLAALQLEDLAGSSVLDVGTGSGILAIAAAALGAARAIGIDNDPDAIQAARENLSINPGVAGVSFELADVAEADTAVQTDIVLANLTGAVLVREAHRLAAALKPRGRLIVSGILAGERSGVMAAFGGLEKTWEGAEDEWLAMRFTNRAG